MWTLTSCWTWISGGRTIMYEILCLMRKRHIHYPNHYDSTNVILNLNFYNYFKDVYKILSDKSLVMGAIPWRKCIDSFVFDNFYLGYCRGEKPFSGGVPWYDAKRIFFVMNLEKKHFVAIEILLSEGKIRVYDCNTRIYSDENFLGHVIPLLELFPRFLKQSGIFNHLPDKLLNQD